MYNTNIKHTVVTCPEIFYWGRGIACSAKTANDLEYSSL